MTYPSPNVAHALRTLLWCSLVNDPADPDSDYTNADEYEASDALIQLVAAEWEDFYNQLTALNFDPSEAYTCALHPDNEGDWWNAVAHDWILTREGHGSGFWDGRLSEPWATTLTNLAQACPEFNLWLDSNGLLYPG